MHLETYPAPATDAPTVLIVHGTLDRAASFRKVQRLLPDYHVLLIDRRGYGQDVSTPPAVDAEQGAADLISALGGRRASIVGHSFGGLLAILAAINASELVCSVGVYEPPQPWQPWWPEHSPANPVGGLPEDPADAVETFFRSMVGDTAWEGLPDSFREARRREGDAMLSDLAAAHLRCPFDLADLLVPMVAAAGGASSDHYRRSAQELVDGSVDAEVAAIPGAQHGGHLSHPEAFADFVRQVVDRGHVPSS